MQRVWKFGGITIGAGGLLGLAVIGFLWSTRPEETVVNSKGGTVSLTEEPSPAAPAGAGQSGQLSVVPSNSDGQGAVLSGSGATDNSRASGSSSAGSSTSSGEPEWPGPESFKQYEALYPDPDKGGAYDIRVGSGNTVVAGDTVSVNYRGWLTDGTLFDQSYTRDQGKPQPFTFKQGTGSVIAGWEQGVIGMKVGGKRRLVLAANLAYGSRPPQGIPANAMLIFDIELLATGTPQ